MNSVGEKASNFLASFAEALRASKRDPLAVADVEEFLALLDEVDKFDLAPWPVRGGESLPVCINLGDAIKSANLQPSWKMAETLDALCEHLIWIQSENYVRSPPSANFLTNYGYAVVAGPPEVAPALLCNNRLAAGLVLFGPQTCYPLHRHPATELYYVVSGHAEWWRGDGPWEAKMPGTLIYHDSGIPHGIRTAAEPLIAAYLWKGDLRTDAYFIE